MDGAAGAGATRASAILRVEKVSVRFGGVRALTEVDLELREGEICGLIGPNGAGKTTLFNSITRFADIEAGAISLAGRRIEGIPARAVVSHGIARTFQNLGVYPAMTVMDNVMLGGRHIYGGSVLRPLVRPLHARTRERALRDRCRALIADLGLEAVAQERAGALSYGYLKRVEIARALASEPRLLLLDEPAGGLTHGEVSAFGELIGRLRAAYGLTVLLVEHHMGLVMSLCGRLVVLHLGRNLAEGTPAEIRADARVVDAYLGRGGGHAQG